MIALKESFRPLIHWVLVVSFGALAIGFEVGWFNSLDENLGLVETLSKRDSQMGHIVSLFNGQMALMEERMRKLNVRLSGFREGEKAHVADRVKQLQPKLDAIIRARIVDAVFDSCEKYKLSPSVIVHLMFRESSFRHMIVSDKGAVGLMQVHPPSHPEKVGKIPKSDLYGIETNIGYGCQILAEYLGSSSSLKEALGKYLGKGHRKSDVQAVLDLVAEYEGLRWRR